MSLRREGRVDDALARMRKAKTVEHALASRPWQDGGAPRMPLAGTDALGTTPIARATPRGATPIAPRLAPATPPPPPPPGAAFPLSSLGRRPSAQPPRAGDASELATPPPTPGQRAATPQTAPYSV